MKLFNGATPIKYSIYPVVNGFCEYKRENWLKTARLTAASTA